MYAQSHAVHYRLKNTIKKNWRRPTRRWTHALLCWTSQNNSNSNEFK